MVKKNFAVVIYPEEDPDFIMGAFSNHRSVVKNLEKHGYEVKFSRVNSGEGLVDFILDATREQPASLIIISGHGNRNSIRLGVYGSYNVRTIPALSLTSVNAKRLLSEIQSSLRKDGVIVLDSCSTGCGEDKEDNLANTLRGVFPQAKRILAPTVDVFCFFCKLIFNEEGEVVDFKYIPQELKPEVSRQKGRLPISLGLRKSAYDAVRLPSVSDEIVTDEGTNTILKTDGGSRFPDIVAKLGLNRAPPVIGVLVILSLYAFVFDLPSRAATVVSAMIASGVFASISPFAMIVVAVAVITSIIFHKKLGSNLITPFLLAFAGFVVFSSMFHVAWIVSISAMIVLALLGGITGVIKEVWETRNLDSFKVSGLSNKDIGYFFTEDSEKIWRQLEKNIKEETNIENFELNDVYKKELIGRIYNIGFKIFVPSLHKRNADMTRKLFEQYIKGTNWYISWPMKALLFIPGGLEFAFIGGFFYFFARHIVEELKYRRALNSKGELEKIFKNAGRDPYEELVSLVLQIEKEKDEDPILYNIRTSLPIQRLRFLRLHSWVASGLGRFMKNRVSLYIAGSIIGTVIAVHLINIPLIVEVWSYIAPYNIMSYLGAYSLIDFLEKWHLSLSGASILNVLSITVLLTLLPRMGQGVSYFTAKKLKEDDGIERIKNMNMRPTQLVSYLRNINENIEAADINEARRLALSLRRIVSLGNTFLGELVYIGPIAYRSEGLHLKYDLESELEYLEENLGIENQEQAADIDVGILSYLEWAKVIYSKAFLETIYSIIPLVLLADKFKFLRREDHEFHIVAFKSFWQGFIHMWAIGGEIQFVVSSGEWAADVGQDYGKAGSTAGNGVETFINALEGPEDSALTLVPGIMQQAQATIGMDITYDVYRATFGKASQEDFYRILQSTARVAAAEEAKAEVDNVQEGLINWNISSNRSVAAMISAESVNISPEVASAFMPEIAPTFSLEENNIDAMVVSLYKEGFDSDVIAEVMEMNATEVDNITSKLGAVERTPITDMLNVPKGDKLVSINDVIITVIVEGKNLTAGVYTRDVLSSKGGDWNLPVVGILTSWIAGWDDVKVTYIDVYGKERMSWVDRDNLDYSYKEILDAEPAEEITEEAAEEVLEEIVEDNVTIPQEDRWSDDISILLPKGGGGGGSDDDWVYTPIIGFNTAEWNKYDSFTQSGHFRLDWTDVVNLTSFPDAKVAFYSVAVKDINTGEDKQYLRTRDNGSFMNIFPGNIPDGEWNITVRALSGAWGQPGTVVSEESKPITVNISTVIDPSLDLNASISGINLTWDSVPNASSGQILLLLTRSDGIVELIYASSEETYRVFYNLPEDTHNVKIVKINSDMYSDRGSISEFNFDFVYSNMTWPDMPSFVKTNLQGKAIVEFLNNDTLNPELISGLWAQVNFENGAVEYWDITPEAINANGTKLALNFDMELNNQTFKVQFYGLEKATNQQIALSEPVDIHVDLGQAFYYIPYIDNYSQDEFGKVTIEFVEPIFKDIVDVYMNVSSLDGEKVDQQWDLSYDDVYNATEKTITLNLGENIPGQEITFTFIGIDNIGRETVDSETVHFDSINSFLLLETIPALTYTQDEAGAVIITLSDSMPENITNISMNVSSLAGESIDNNLWELNLSQVYNQTDYTITLNLGETIPNQEITFTLIGYDDIGKKTVDSEVIHFDSINSALWDVEIPQILNISYNSAEINYDIILTDIAPAGTEEVLVRMNKTGTEAILTDYIDFTGQYSSSVIHNLTIPVTLDGESVDIAVIFKNAEGKDTLPTDIETIPEAKSQTWGAAIPQISNIIPNSTHTTYDIILTDTAPEGAKEVWMRMNESGVPAVLTDYFNVTAALSDNVIRNIAVPAELNNTDVAVAAFFKDAEGRNTVLTEVRIIEDAVSFMPSNITTNSISISEITSNVTDSEINETAIANISVNIENTTAENETVIYDTNDFVEENNTVIQETQDNETTTVQILDIVNETLTNQSFQDGLLDSDNDSVENTPVNDSPETFVSTDSDPVVVQDIIKYTDKIGNLTIDVTYDPNTGEATEVTTDSTVETNEKTDIAVILYGSNDTIYRIEKGDDNTVTLYDYTPRIIILEDIASTDSKTKECVSYITPFYREKLLAGEESVEAAYTKHTGPYIDANGTIFYKDSYCDFNNREIGWETKNLDGTIHKFDGIGTKASRESRLIMWNDSIGKGFAYYTDRGGKNPDGTIHIFDGKDPNGVIWSEYISQLTNITNNADSATLKNGEVVKVHSLAFMGGVITEQGYYIPRNYIETLNVGEESYKYIPPYRLNWVMGRIDGEGLFESKMPTLIDSKEVIKASQETNDSIAEVILPANNSPPVDDSATPYQIAITGDTVGVEAGELNFTEKEVLINPYDMSLLANASIWISADRLFLPGEIENLALKPTDHLYSFLYLNVKEGEVSIRFKDEEGKAIAERINGELIFNGPNSLLALNEEGLSREVDMEVLQYQPMTVIVNVTSSGESAGVYAKDILSSKGLGWNKIEITYIDIYGNQLQAWVNKDKLNYSAAEITPYMIDVGLLEKSISEMVGSGEVLVIDNRTGLEAIAKNSSLNKDRGFGPFGKDDREVIYNDETYFVDEGEMAFVIFPQIAEKVKGLDSLIKSEKGWPADNVKIVYFERGIAKQGYIDSAVFKSLEPAINIYLIDKAREYKPFVFVPTEIDMEKAEDFINGTKGEKNLYASHPGDGIANGDKEWNKDYWGFTYDQSLVAMYYITTGQPEKAKEILDFFAYEANRTEAGLFYTAYDINTGEPKQEKSPVGPGNWIGIAMAWYTEVYDDLEYLSEIEEINNNVLNYYQNSNYGISGEEKYGWMSAEQAEGTYTVVDYLAKKTGNESYAQTRNEVYTWFYNYVYDKETGVIYRGEDDKEIALDALAWGVSSPLPDTINRTSLINFAEEHIEVTVIFTREDGQKVNVTGFAFGPGQEMVTPEWTGEMIDIYRNGTKIEFKQPLDVSEIDNDTFIVENLKSQLDLERIDNLRLIVPNTKEPTTYLNLTDYYNSGTDTLSGDILFAPANYRILVEGDKPVVVSLNVSEFERADSNVSLDITPKNRYTNMEKAVFYLWELAKMQNSQGGIPYATSYSADTGHYWRTPPAEVNSSLSSTIYPLFGLRGFSPLDIPVRNAHNISEPEFLPVKDINKEIMFGQNLFEDKVEQMGIQEPGNWTVVHINNYSDYNMTIWKDSEHGRRIIRASLNDEYLSEFQIQSRKNPLTKQDSAYRFKELGYKDCYTEKDITYIPSLEKEDFKYPLDTPEETFIKLTREEEKMVREEIGLPSGGRIMEVINENTGKSVYRLYKGRELQSSQLAVEYDSEAETAVYLRGAKHPLFKVDTSRLRGETLIITASGDYKSRAVKVDNIIEVYYPGIVNDDGNKENVIFEVDLRTKQVSAVKKGSVGENIWQVVGKGPVNIDFNNPVSAISGRKDETGSIVMTAYDSKANALWSRTADEKIVFSHGEYSHVVDLLTREITRIFPILSRDHKGNVREVVVIDFDGMVESKYYEFSLDKDAMTLEEVEKVENMTLPLVIKEQFNNSYGDISLRFDREIVGGDYVLLGNLIGHYDKPVISISDRKISIDLEDETVFSYTAKGCFSFNEERVKQIDNYEDVYPVLKGFAEEQGVNFTGRDDDLEKNFNETVKHMKAADIWERTDYDGKTSYVIYDREYAVPVISIDDIRIYFGKSNGGGFWSKTAVTKDPVDVPVTTPPTDITINKEQGVVASRDELAEFPFLDISDFPENLEKYNALSGSEFWFSRYQEPADVHGRLIVQISGTEEGRYVYYVKDYDEERIFEPKLAYKLFNSKNEEALVKAGEDEFSEVWEVVYKYEKIDVQRLDAISEEVGVQREELFEEIKDPLTFIEFSQDIKYDQLSPEDRIKVDNTEFLKMKVTDTEGQTHISYVVSGDTEGREIIKHRQDGLTNILIVSSKFFGFTITPMSGIIVDLNNNDIYDFKNIDMKDAVVYIDKKPYQIPDEKEPETPGYVIGLHRVAYENRETGRWSLRWFPTYDPVGGRDEISEQGYFKKVLEPYKNAAGEIIPGKAEWVTIGKTLNDQWSSIGQIPLNSTYSEYDWRIHDFVDLYTASTKEKEGLINTSNASGFGLSEADWDKAIVNFRDTQDRYLTDGEIGEWETIANKGVNLRENEINYSYGAMEIKYYSFHPAQDARIVVKDNEIFVNLNWTSDEKGSFYAKTLVIDKHGLGVKAIYIATSDFIGLPDVITPEFAKEYKEKTGRDIWADIGFYRGIYGIEDGKLRVAKKIELSLDGEINRKALIETAKYSPQGLPTTYHYTFAEDITAKEMMAVVPISENDNKTSINMWWIKNNALFGVLPQGIIFKDGEVQINTYKEKVYYIDWYNPQTDRVENKSILELTNGKYEYAFISSALNTDSNILLKGETKLPSGKLIQEEYEYQKPRIFNIIPVTRGFESIQYNISLSYKQPLFGFETEEKYWTKIWTKIDYFPQGSVQIVKEKEGMAPNNEYTHKYEYDLFGNQDDKARINILSKWKQDMSSGLMIWIFIPASVFFLVMLAGRILFKIGQRKRAKERKKSEEDLEVNISREEIDENILKVEELLNNPPDYGFEDGIVEEAKQYFRENIIQKLEKRPLQAVIEEVFDRYGYQDFLENVMKKTLDVNKLTLEDVYLWQCINRGGMNFSTETPDFISYLFWKSKEREEKGEPRSIGPFVKECVTIWFRIMQLQIGSLKGVIPFEFQLIYNDVNELFRTKEFIEGFEEKVLSGGYQDLIEELEEKVDPLANRDKGKIQEFKKKFGEQNIVKITRELLKTEEFKAYKRFIFAEWKREEGHILIRKALKQALIREIFLKILESGISLSRKINAYLSSDSKWTKRLLWRCFKGLPDYLRNLKGTYYETPMWPKDSLFWKTFADKNGGRFGWKGWASLLRNTYRVTTIFLIILYVASCFGLVPAIGISGCIFIGVILAVILVSMKWGLEEWLKIRNHSPPTRMDEGVTPVKNKKVFRLLYWASVFAPWLAWNGYVFLYLGIATKALWPVTLLNGGSLLNLFAIGIIWFPFIIFFFLSIFSFFYFVESIVSYLHGKYLGVGTIKFWDEVEGNFEIISEKFTEKFIPEKLSLTAEQKEIVWAKVWNLIIKTFYEQDRLSREEMQRYSYGLKEDSNGFLKSKISDKPEHKPDLSMAPEIKKTTQRIIWFASQCYMGKPGVSVWQKLFSLTVFTPVGDEEIIYTFEEINELDEKIGTTVLNKFLSICPDEWKNFIERMRSEKKYSEEDLKKMENLKLGEVLDIGDENLKFEIRLWVSYRFQPLVRTVRGIMYYKDILTLLAKVNFPKESEKYIQDEVYKKFRYTIALDKYYRWKTEIDEKKADLRRKAKDIETLMRIYPEFLHIVHISKDDNGWYTSLARGEVDPNSGEVKIKRGAGTVIKEDLTKGLFENLEDEGYIDDKGNVKDKIKSLKGYSDMALDSKYEDEKEEIYDVLNRAYDENSKKIRLAGMPILGEGKPEGQNNGLKFVRGEKIVSIDINQDFYLEQWFMMPNLLQIFKKNSDIKLIGFAEDIATDDYNAAAKFNAFADGVFTAIVRPILTLILANFHFGHPDVWDEGYVRKRGTSRASFISEDIFGGFEVAMRGGLIEFSRFIKGAKLREVSFVTMEGLLRKFAMGVAQVGWGRYLWTICTSPVFGLDRVLGLLIGVIGFMLRKPWVKIGIYGYILFTVAMGLSGFAPFPSEIIFGILALLFMQAITMTGYSDLLLEKGFWRGTKQLVKMVIFEGMMPYFMAHVFTYANGVQITMETVARYVATGRGFMLYHIPLFVSEPFDEKGGIKPSIFNAFKTSHIRPGFIAGVIVFVGLVLWQNITLVWSLFYAIMVFSAFFVPILWNPGSTPAGIGNERWKKLFEEDCFQWLLALKLLEERKELKFEGWVKLFKEVRSQLPVALRWDFSGEKYTRWEKCELFVGGFIVIIAVGAASFIVIVFAKIKEKIQKLFQLFTSSQQPRSPPETQGDGKTFAAQSKLIDQEGEEKLDGGNDADKNELPLFWKGSIPWVGEFETREVSCAVCESSNYEVIGRVVINGKEMNIVKCIYDGFMWLNPQPTGGFYKKLHEKPYFLPVKGKDLEQVGIIEYGSKEVEEARKRVACIRADELEAALNRKGRVLEIGPASGYLMKELVSRGWKVEGVDISEDIAEVALKRGLKGKVHTGELKDLHYPDDSFDGVLVYDTLEHIPLPKDFMQEVKRILKPEGIVIIRYPETPDTGPELHLGDHISHFTMRSIGILLDKTGFKKVSLSPSGIFYGTKGRRIQNMTAVAKKPVLAGVDIGQHKAFWTSTGTWIIHILFLQFLCEISSIAAWLNLELISLPEIVLMISAIVGDIGFMIFLIHSLIIFADLTMKRSSSIVTDVALYKWIRHPMYLGTILIAQFFMLQYLHPVIIAFCLIWFYLINNLSAKEEEYLKLRFPLIYIPYTKRTGRFIPPFITEIFLERKNDTFKDRGISLAKDLDGGTNQIITQTLAILKGKETIELPLKLGSVNVYEEANKYKIIISSKSERGPPEAKIIDKYLLITIHPEDLNTRNIAILIHEEIIKYIGLQSLFESGKNSEKAEEIVTFATQRRYELESALWSKGLTKTERAYFKNLYRQYRHMVEEMQKIGEKLHLAASLTKEQLRELLGAVNYKAIKGVAKYKEAAKKAVEKINDLNGGIGKKVGREEYLAAVWEAIGRQGEVKLGAKSSDLYIIVELEGKIEYVSIAEAKLLYLIREAEKGTYKKIIVEELASEETIESIEELYDTVYLYHRMNEGIPEKEKKTYRDIFAESERLELRMPLTENTFPTINNKSEMFTEKVKMPGGHGVSGYNLIIRSLDEPVEEGEVGVVYNQDGVNNRVTPELIGYAVEERIPVIMVGTERTEIDVKGGIFGLLLLKVAQGLRLGNVVKTIIELNQAKNAGQEKEFNQAGLTEEMRGKQPFNTNTVVINYGVLVPFLKDVRDVLGEEKLYEILSPTIIEEDSKDKMHTGLGGAIGSVMLNLAAYLETIDKQEIEEEKKEAIKGLFKKHRISAILSIVNVGVDERIEFFTPVKTAFDFYLQFYTDYYRMNTKEWKLEANKPVPPAASLSGYYDNVLNCFDAFKEASFINLESLKIEGKVNLQKAILKGKVEILSEHEEVIDLNKAKELKGLKEKGRLVLENIEIHIDKEGKVKFDGGKRGINSDCSLFQRIEDYEKNSEELDQKSKKELDGGVRLLSEKLFNLFTPSLFLASVLSLNFESVLASIISFASAYPTISAILVLGAGVKLFCIIWHYVFSVSWYIRRLKNKDDSIRQAAAQALGELGDKRAVNPLINMLDDLDPNVRSNAAQALGKLGDKRAVKPLINRLNDSGSSVSSNAAQALGELGDKRAIEPLFNRLSNSSLCDYPYAAQVLGKLGDKRAIKPLINRLSDSNSGVSSSAAQALGKLGDKRAVRLLITRLSDSSSGVRSNAAQALGELGDKRAIEPLINRLSDSDLNIRSNAAQALEKLDTTKEQMVAGYVEALDSPDLFVRRDATEALGKLGNKRAIETLINKLSDSSSGVSSNAAEALGRLGNKRAVEPLIKALGDPDSYVRRDAAEALGRLGNKRAVEPLITRLSDSNSNIRSNAAQALERLGATKEQIVAGYIEALDSSDLDVRRDAARILGELGNKRAVEPLINRLSDSNSNIRSNAAQALKKLNAAKKQMVVGYVEALDSPDLDVRRDAAEALGRLGNKRAVEPLIKALGDPNFCVREHAAEALGRLGDKRAVEPLIKALGDPDSYVRRDATEALGRLGDKRAVEPLINRLSDSDSNIRSNAAQALGRLGDKRAVKLLINKLSDPDPDSNIRSNAAQALKELNATKEQMVAGYIEALDSSDSNLCSNAAEGTANSSRMEWNKENVLNSREVA